MNSFENGLIVSLLHIDQRGNSLNKTQGLSEAGKYVNMILN